MESGMAKKTGAKTRMHKELVKKRSGTAGDGKAKDFARAQLHINKAKKLSCEMYYGECYTVTFLIHQPNNIVIIQPDEKHRFFLPLFHKAILMSDVNKLGTRIALIVIGGSKKANCFAGESPGESG